MPHLRILPRSRLCQNLTRRNALQIFGYVPAERILAITTRRRCRWALRRSGGGLLSEEGRRGGEEAALCEADVVRQPAP